MKIVIEISEGTYSAVVSDYWCGDPIFRQAIINGQIIPTYNIEPCEDAISRAEAIRIASGYCHFSNVPKELAKLPPVTPEPKMGRWIEEDMYDGDVAYRCSECKELFWIESGTPKDNEYNFCPKCGKRLIEPRESNHKCQTCRHYTSGDYDGSCGSYICKGYSDWERKVEE